MQCTEGTAGKKMPPRKAKNQPTKQEIEVLRNWIKAGAKDDSEAQKKDAPSKQSYNHGPHGEKAVAEFIANSPLPLPQPSRSLPL